MVGWQCPQCDDEQVCSVFEFRRIYNYRKLINLAGRRLTDELQSRGVVIQNDEDAADAALRWVQQANPETVEDKQSVNGPRYICPTCYQPWTKHEVPA
jgi:hypothetical protein